jgi:hypothetical protein
MTTISDDGDGAGDDDGIKRSRTIESLVLCFIITFSIIGNTSLWIVVIKSKGLRTVTNMFILGLSAAGNVIVTLHLYMHVAFKK